MIPEMVRAFSRAGLAIKVLGGPIQPRNRGIFQLGIFHNRYFRVWPGASDTEFAVLDADNRFRQVVLCVREPRRRFEELVLRAGRRTREETERYAATVGGRLCRESGRHWVIERWTPEGNRLYLAGFDERSLFIVQIPAGATVREAHHELMPREVRESGAPVVRQGEWFFLPATSEELRLLGEYMPGHPRSCRREEALAQGGNPHVAEVLVRVDHRERRKGREIRRLDIFVRGRVRHAEHGEVRLEGWHLVVRNAAIQPAAPDRERMRWID